MEVVLWILIGLLFALSFVGLVVPVLPGTVLIFLGFLIYHFGIDNTQLTRGFWISMILLAALGFVVDTLASGFFAKTYGGSKGAFWAAVAGAILGPILLGALLGPLSLVVGPMVAVVGFELFRGRDLQQALRVGWGTFLGFLSGTLFKVLIHIVMIAWFFILIF